MNKINLHRRATNKKTIRLKSLEDRAICTILASFFGVFISLFFSGSAYCASPNVSFGCSTCHENGAEILPSSHKNYDIKNTTLCFGCHRLNGKARTLGDKIHLVHMRKNSGLISNCALCHTVSEQGEAGLPGLAAKASAQRMAKLKKFFLSSTISPYLDHSHNQNGVSCEQCHGKQELIEGRKEPDTHSHCVRCHGDYAEMIKKTAKSRYEKNPHKSHLPDLQCSACHHAHKAFEDICASCHSFDYRAPAH
jgi:hypothetical protein